MNSNYKKGEIDKLKGFIATVEHGTIAEAAKNLAISESVISAQISSLEQDLKTKLFDKVKGKLILNNKGKAFYPKAKKVFFALEEAFEKKIEGDIEVVKISVHKRLIEKMKEIRKKKLDKYEKIFMKYLIKFRNMIVKLKMRYIAIFIILAGIGLCLVYERTVQSYYINKSSEMVNSITRNISQVEKQIADNQVKAMLIFKSLLKQKPNPTQQDLIDWSKKLRVTSISSWNSEGALIQSTHPRNAEFLKTYRKIKNCQDEIDMKRVDGSVKIYPLKNCGENCRFGAQKCLTSWHSDINGFLNVDMADADIKNILKDNVASDEILSITLSSPNGTIIESVYDENIAQAAPQVLRHYSETPIINQSNNTTTITKMFSKIEKFNCNAYFGKSVGNPDHDYFYVLTAVFDKKDVNNKISIIRVTFAIITLVILLILYCVGLKQNGVIDLRTARKKKATITKQSKS